jgi:hypothetical protein
MIEGLQMLKETEGRLTELLGEATARANKIREMFPGTSSDYLLMLLTVNVLFRTFPALVKHPDAERLLMEWIVAGEPENLAEVPKRMLARLGPERYHRYEKARAQTDTKQ